MAGVGVPCLSLLEARRVMAPAWLPALSDEFVLWFTLALALLVPLRLFLRANGQQQEGGLEPTLRVLDAVERDDPADVAAAAGEKVH